jgi:hypothetical protein
MNRLISDERLTHRLNMGTHFDFTSSFLKVAGGVIIIVSS